jgi:hypothetical protein
MNAIPVIRWLVRDTFVQALHSGVFWLMLALTVVCVALCLSTSVIDGDPGHLDLAGGAFHWPLVGGLDHAVRGLELQLAGWVADGVGLLLALMWTAGFLPSFLEPGAVSVLLTKPVPRWSLLAGKVLGVFAFVAFQSALFLRACRCCCCTSPSSSASRPCWPWPRAAPSPACSAPCSSGSCAGA